MDGYETAQRFKSDPGLAAIPLVGVSSFAMVGDRAKALKVGFAGYIEKPINTDTFAREVSRFLSIPSGGSDNPGHPEFKPVI
jgi:CheY-like chemotaxis protein